MSKIAPTEGKVYNATIGSGIGVVATPFILWLLGVTIWNVPIDAASEFQAIQAVPTTISVPIGVLVLMGSTFFGGWVAKHTPRPEVTEALDDMNEIEEEIATDTELDELDETIVDPDLPEDDEVPDVPVQDEEVEVVVQPQRSV
jgi:hypothetical protein